MRLAVQTWLALRNAEQLADNFTGFHMTALVVYLLKERRLGTHLSALQAFRIALDFICTKPYLLALEASKQAKRS